MNRRTFLKTSSAITAAVGVTGLTSLLLRSAWADKDIADGQSETFNFDLLQQRAATLAKQPWQADTTSLPATLATLTPDKYNKIGYRAGCSLWHNLQQRQLDINFFHVGMGFKRRVRMYSVDKDKQQAREITFRPALFDYQGVDIDVQQLTAEHNLGFAGFRVFQQPELTKKDIIAFLGASYFRAVDKTKQYGISARGVAVNTYSQVKEEFPDFTAFWFETPAADATSFVVYALLEGPSLTGAYRFIMHCEGERVVMEVTTHLFARNAIEQLGIAPMTSMFSCGSNERRVCHTYHPLIHDSDRLSMWRGNGEWITRPLNNPRNLQFNSYQDENPRGFGLVQYNHDFNSYQDVIGRYDLRPSLWVEPVGQWGKGAINLIELPTVGETYDNIACFWSPTNPILAGSTHTFCYKLYWSSLPPVQPTLAQVTATRIGMGGFPEGWAAGDHFPDKWCQRFAIDFTGSGLKAAANRGIKPIITLSAGRYQRVEILYVQPLDSYRILFDWYPENEKTEPVDMRLFLQCQGEAISETWLYVYLPPPADQRYYRY